MSLNDLALAFVVGVVVGIMLRGRVNTDPQKRGANILGFTRFKTDDLKKYGDKLRKAAG